MLSGAGTASAAAKVRALVGEQDGPFYSCVSGLEVQAHCY
jgi:hypothetical protein